LARQKGKFSLLMVIFIVVSIFSAFHSGYNLLESIGYHDQCKPHYAFVSMKAYVAGNALSHDPEIVAMNSNIDTHSSAAKAALESAKAEFRQTDWYRNEYRESILFVVLAVVLVLITVAMIVYGLIIRHYTKLMTSKSELKMIAIIFALIVVTIINFAWPNKPYRYLPRFQGPMILAPVAGT